MDKLNRLPWKAGVAFSAYGVPFGLRSTSHSLLMQLLEYLPPDWKPKKSPLVYILFSAVEGSDATPANGAKRFHLLYSDSNRLARSMNLQEIIDAFQAHVNFAVAANSEQATFVNAGVVEWKGKAIVLPGRSLTGKSVLTNALIKAGATFYSDGYAPIDSDGLVRPYPVSFRKSGHDDDERHGNEDVQSLDYAKTVGPLPIGLVVGCEYVPGQRWNSHVLSMADTVQLLLNNTIRAREDPATALSVLARAVTGSVAVRSIRGEAEEAAQAILRLMESKA